MFLFIEILEAVTELILVYWLFRARQKSWLCAKVAARCSLAQSTRRSHPNNILPKVPTLQMDKDLDIV